MIKEVLSLLEAAKGETENIKMAQGKYNLPSTFKGAFKQIKKEIRWRKKSK
jgi:hypothetical protein|tara:strand:- start:503 stop:655 length:153 start_codon:yes stop_codon:yes gene_type:complete